MSYSLPYSGKFSREKIFANFMNYGLFAKILSANVLFFVDKDTRAIALIREKLYLAHSRKISPAKISRYMVLLTAERQFEGGVYSRRASI